MKRERKGLETTKDYRGKGRSKAGSSAINTIQEQCSLCKGIHPLTKCQEFKKKRVEERREFVKTKGLCFGCLKSGHLSSSCRFRLTCEECGKPHPTLLHISVQAGKRPLRNSKQRNSNLQAKNLPIAAGFASITSATSQRARTRVCVVQQVHLTLKPPPL